MPIICYHASQEQFAPSHLLALAIQAEQAGFGGIHSSDHFHPWSRQQGQSGFTFSWIAAAMQATTVPFSMICAPGQRLHPAIVAQAIATLGQLFPGRINVELGSGEYLNEHITGEPWPEKNIRNERLKECAEVIKRLLSGETVTHSGHVQVKEAKLYTRPAEMPLLLGAALTDATARWLGNWADGLLTTAGTPAETLRRVEQFRENGGAGKPVYLQKAFSYAPDYQQAAQAAWQQWRYNLVSIEQLATMANPEDFEAAGKNISIEEVTKKIPVYTHIGQLKEALQQLQDTIHPDRIVLHNINPWQEQFIEHYARN
ncbi:MAG: TIGR03885 family FMN-dependent LLM class oxidoreductase [Niastella sp.]|nr:TIGR03885 family FMN-dependent LLM class oxidoreductase [Niastella sp.]